MVAARGDGERWLMVREAAARLGVSYMTVVNRVAARPVIASPPLGGRGVARLDAPTAKHNSALVNRFTIYGVSSALL